MAEKLNYITSSKKQIYDAYKAALEELDAKNAAVIDPAAEQKKKEAERIAASAEEVVTEDLVSPALAQKYKDLKAQIAVLETRLAELTGFENAYYNIVAIKNAYVSTKADLDAKAIAERNARAEANDNLVANLNKQLEDAKAALAAYKKTAQDEKVQFDKDLATARAREAAEYKYNLDRSHTIENDKWNDEKAAREKAMNLKEAELESRIAEVEVREDKLADLEAEIASIPEKIAKATSDGIAKGKSDAEKSHVFEKRAMERNAECDKKELNNKIELLESTVASQEAKIASLEEKLDAAYVRNQQLAEKAVASSGVKVLTAEQTSGK